MAAKLVLTFKSKSSDDLRERAKRLTRTGPPLQLRGAGLSVQFLRGVFSRASMCVPAFYYFLGATSGRDLPSEDYPLNVARSYADFSDLNTLTLSCRKLFDHSTKPDLTGGNFAKLPDDVLREHAAYWAKTSTHSTEDAFNALTFLRRFFGDCSQTDTRLLQSDGLLQKRIGLLKQHADRAAAHLTLEDYAIDIIDLAHFTAACVLVGEIVRSFDHPALGSEYFDKLDAASYKAAARIFPQIAKFQLFTNWRLEKQARLYWQNSDVGMQMLLNEMQYALGGEPSGDA